METKSQVSKPHPDYSRMADSWQSCRDCVAGQKAIHAAGERYLPKLTDQTTDDYSAYKTRAQYMNFVWKTISALSGMIFRRPPVIDVAPSVEPYLDDVTMSGISFHILAQRATLEVLTTGRLGILVDYPQQSVEGMTLADAQKLNLRPSMNVYPAESIINWRMGRVGNQTVLTMVVLIEDHAEDDPDNPFKQKTETRYRVLDLFNGAYRVRVFRIDDKGEDEQVGDDLLPLMNGKPLDFIPFYFIGVDDTTPEIDDPPLNDLVDLNLDHYRLDADYKHGLHFTGLPTPVVSGYQKQNENEKLYVGSSSAWVFPDPQASATYLEYTGQGLSAIEAAKASDEQNMAILGARLLASEKKSTETAQAARIYRAGESSILSAISATISIGLTGALRTFSEWAGVASECSIQLNSEFLPHEITPEELTSLVSAWQSGAISMQVLFEQLQKKEVIASDLTLEEMQAQIGSEGPRMPDMGE